jgi:hypothetical protein
MEQVCEFSCFSAVNLIYDFSLKTGLYISRNRNWNLTDWELLGATRKKGQSLVISINIIWRLNKTAIV